MIHHRPAHSIRASLATLLAAIFVMGAAPPPTPLSADDTALVSKAVAYLEGLSSAKGRFEQTDARGDLTTGTFYLQRPGRARFDYDPPSGLAIASDGHEVSVVNRRLKTIQSYPLGMTPLGLFLAKNIRLDRGVVVRAVEHTAGGFTVVAGDRRGSVHGSIALDFTDAPLRLTGWTIIDGRAQSVRVRLAQLSPSPPLSPGFFELYHQPPTAEPGT
jgi:outer membrane lipoprotein-sorting protein